MKQCASSRPKASEGGNQVPSSTAPKCNRPWLLPRSNAAAIRFIAGPVRSDWPGMRVRCARPDGLVVRPSVVSRVSGGSDRSWPPTESFVMTTRRSYKNTTSFHSPSAAKIAKAFSPRIDGSAILPVIVILHQSQILARFGLMTQRSNFHAWIQHLRTTTNNGTTRHGIVRSILRRPCGPSSCFNLIHLWLLSLELPDRQAHDGEIRFHLFNSPWRSLHLSLFAYDGGRLTSPADGRRYRKK